VKEKDVSATERKKEARVRRCKRTTIKSKDGWAERERKRKGTMLKPLLDFSMGGGVRSPWYRGTWLRERGGSG